MCRFVPAALLISALALVSVVRASLPSVSTGQWTLSSDMMEARDGAAAALLFNGDTLIAGGTNTAGVLQTAEIYQADGTIAAAASMSTARARHSLTALQDGRVLAVGGDAGNGAATNAAELYDPVTDGWTAAGPLWSARFGHTATLLPDGRVAIIGGQNNGTPVATIEVFDPATNSFSVAANLGTARMNHAAAVLADGRILISGGFTLDAQGNPVALASAEIFDPKGNSVTTAAPMNTARASHSATAVLDGLIVVAGGSNGQADLNSIETYAPATDTWTVSAATFSQARSGHIATLLPKNNSVLISGGTFNGVAALNAEIYQPWTGAVISAGTMNAAHVAGTGSAFGVDGLYLAAGGSGNKSTELFRFATIATDKPDYAPGTPVLMTGSGYQPNETVNLVLAQDDGDPTSTTPVQADASGNISYQGFAPDNGDLGTHFHLTAIGQSSAFQAQTVFTDKNPSTTTITAVTGTYGGSVTLTATVTSGGSPVAGEAVKFFFNGSNTGLQGTTNASGVATVNTNLALAGVNIGAGTYPGSIGNNGNCTGNGASGVCASFNGNNQLNGSVGAAALTVTKAGLTITANNRTKTYGQTVTFAGTEFTTSGLISPDTVTSAALTSPGVSATASVTGSPYAIVPGAAAGTGLTNYNITYVNGTLTVNLASVTAAVTANNKVYDGTASATQKTCTLAGVVAADAGNMTCSSGTLAFADKNVGAAKSVTISGISLSGSAASNYQLISTTGTATADITARAITVTAATNSKTYDGTTSAAAIPTITSGALQGSDTASFVETYDTKHVGTGKTLTPSGSVNDGNSGNNYNYTFATNTSGVINARPITVTAAANSKVYDGTTSAAAIPTITTGTLATGDSSALSESYDTRHVGTTKTLSPSGTVKDSGAADVSSDYAITFSPINTGIITARPITVSATNDTKTYDGTTASSAIPSITTGSLAGGDTSAFTQVFDSRNAGARTLTASGSINDGNSGNDYAVTFAAGAGTINKRPITVTAVADSKVYDGTTSSAGTPAISVNTITIGDSAGFAQTFDTRNAGTNKTLTPSGSVSDGNSGNNYAVTFANNTSGVITARPLTVTAAANTKTYDGKTSAAATPTITSGAIQGTDTASFTETYDNKNAGTGKTLTPAGSIADGNGGNNYNVTFAAVSTGVINQRPLTVSATADNRIYDRTTNATAHLSDDRVAGDLLTDSYTTAAFADKNVGAGKAVSVSGISVTGADSGNYTFNTNASTTANISPRDLTVTATADNKVYDRTITAVVHVADNRVAGDLLSPTFASANFADRNVGTGKTVTVSGIAIGGTDAGNYNLSNTTASATADITAKAVTPVIAANNKVYDRTTTATLSSQSASGAIAPDAVSLTITSASFDTRNAGTGKTVTAIGLALGGADAGNYSLNGTTTATASADITPRPLTVSATGADRIYDGTLNASVTLADDHLSGDAVTDSYTAASFADKNVGSAKTISVSGISISGADSGNYSLNNTTASAKASISPRNLTVSATGIGKIYDGTPSATVTLSDDRIAGDLLGDAYTSASFADKNVGTGKAVSVSGISVTGTDAGNYTFNVIASTVANITPRPLIVTATGVSRIYNGTASATVTLADNRVPGDSVTDSYTSASFSDKNAGSNKYITVNGISISGSDAGNYSLANNTASASADIAQLPIAITALTDSKVYDGSATSAAAPQLSISLAAGDTGTFNESFESKNAGNNKVLIPAASITDGNGGNNYAVTLLNNNTGTITARPLVVSATGISKQYDGTASATVSLTDNRIAGDMFSDGYSSASFSDRNVGAGKPVAVSGISITGNDAANYTPNTTASTSANITARALTINAVSDAKVFDGTAASSATPTISAPGIAAGDSGSFSQAFDGSNAGPHSLIASGNISDSNNGNNYALTFVPAAGTINKATPLVSVSGGPFTFDGGSHGATITVTGVGGAAVSGSSAVTYNGVAANPANAGTYAVGVNFTSADGNYNNATGSGSILIDKASSSTAISGTFSFTFDGTAHPASVSVTGAGGLNLTPDPVYSCGHAPINVADSGCTASFGFAGDDNHNPSSDSRTYTIGKAVPLVSVSGGPFTFDGATHPATIAVTGVGGAPVSGSSAVTYNGSASSPVDAGTYAVGVNFTSADNNYDNATGIGSISIVKAASTTTVAGVFSFTFDGNAHPASVFVTGAGGLNLTPDPVYSCGHAPMNVADSGCTASFSFAGDTNHNPSSDSKTYTIGKAIPLLTVSGGPFTFDGSAHAASTSATGIGGVAVSGSWSVTYNGVATVPSNAGAYNVVANFTSGDGNYDNASGTGSSIINEAPSVTIVNGVFSFTYDGNAHPATISVTGAGGLNLAPAPNYSCGHAPMNVTDSGCIASYNFAGDANHTGSSDAKSYIIAKATPVLSLNPLTPVTIGNPFTISGTVKLNSLIPTGTVAITVNGITQAAAIGAGGVFSTMFAAGSIGVGNFAANAVYSGDGNFVSVSNNATTLVVEYNVCLLYDATKSVKSGATYPVKLYLCDAGGRDLSSAGIVLHATSLSMVSGWTGAPEDAGNANPDMDFRYDSTLGPSGGYIFNLKTTGLSGTYNLNFTATGDSMTHAVPFGVK